MTLSVIVIQIDSLNRHFLSTYGASGIHTPNLDAFARRASVFEQHYAGSLPCMPARREIWTGTEECWWRGWGPLEPWDRPAAYLANQAGVVTQLITDHYHFFEWGAHSYHHDFQGYEFIRGHEHDNHRTAPLREEPAWARRMLEQHGEGARIYLRNTAHVQTEEDFFAPRVMRATTDWLSENHTLPRFYLHVDCFDVHEPFHIPEPYRSMYTSEPPEPFNPWPRYGRTNDPDAPVTERDLAWVRAQFAGKLTMVDTWLGRVFDALDRHDLWKRTCVILTTDHGHYLGEHDRIGKPASPLWNTLTHLPLLAWHPQHAPRRVHALTQTVDVHATLLDVLGIRHEGPHARSLLPLLGGERETHRTHATFAYANARVGITDGNWTLLRDHEPSAAAAHQYSLQIGQLDTRSYAARFQRPTSHPDITPGHFIPGVATPQWRIPDASANAPRLHAARKDLLYHVAADPKQQRDLLHEHPEQARRLEELLRAHMTSLGVPTEQYDRLRLQRPESRRA